MHYVLLAYFGHFITRSMPIYNITNSLNNIKAVKLPAVRFISDVKIVKSISMSFACFLKKLNLRDDFNGLNCIISDSKTIDNSAYNLSPVNKNGIFEIMTKTKIAVVTGANKGLGYAIVKILCKEYEGRVYLTSRDDTRGLQACEELKTLGLSPEYQPLDITNSDSVLKFIKGVKDRNEEVDILVNNAGVLFLKDAKEPKVHQADATLLVNFFSLVIFTENVLPLLSEGARIVNISSSSGHLSRIPSSTLRKRFSSEDFTFSQLKTLVMSYLESVRQNEDVSDIWGDSPYVVSKVAVNAYTFMLHRRLSPRGILVNCVHPGYVISDMTRGSGSVSPEDAAVLPAGLALRPTSGGQFVWHDGTSVPWDGPDPRGFIDGKQ